jgi:hypothetical protein
MISRGGTWKADCAGLSMFRVGSGAGKFAACCYLRKYRYVPNYMDNDHAISDSSAAASSRK